MQNTHQVFGSDIITSLETSHLAIDSDIVAMLNLSWTSSLNLIQLESSHLTRSLTAAVIAQLLFSCVQLFYDAKC